MLLYYTSLFNFLEESVYTCLENHSRIVMHLSVQIIDFAIIYNTLGSHQDDIHYSNVYCVSLCLLFSIKCQWKNKA